MLRDPLSRAMHIALISVYSHTQCTLKDVAGGYGTVFDLGPSLAARFLARAKSRIIRLPALSMGTLAAIAKRAGHEVSVHELQRHEGGWDPAPACDLAVLHSSIVDAAAEVAVVEELRARGIRTMVYGAFASARPEIYSAANVIVRGEPENLGGELFARSLDGNIDAGFVNDLNALPWPDWHAFPRHRYAYAFLARPGRVLPIHAARGCVFGCGYCPFRVTAPFRQRAVDDVVAEARYLRDVYGAQALCFRDPLFNWNRERTLELAGGLRPLGLSFSAEMRPDLIDEPLLRRLYDSGLRSLEIGVESADRELLARERRLPPEADQIAHVVSLARRLGIRVVANFMLGLPGDTRENIRATVAYAKRLNPFAVQFTIATPYPGTRLETQVRGRLRVAAGDNYTGWRSTFDHPSLTATELEHLREWAYLSYHFRPSYVLDASAQMVRELYRRRASRFSLGSLRSGAPRLVEEG